MKRITISVPDAVMDKAQRAVESGEATNISAYFTDVATREPDWALARAVVDKMIDEAGGLTDAEIAWAEESLGVRVPELVAA